MLELVSSFFVCDAKEAYLNTVTASHAKKGGNSRETRPSARLCRDWSGWYRALDLRFFGFFDFFSASIFTHVHSFSLMRISIS